jgi:hypothetical protein
VQSLLRGTDQLIIIFSPHSFLLDRNNGIKDQKIIFYINEKLAKFNSNDIRVIIVDKDNPLTNRRWGEYFSLEIETFSDLSLSLSKMLVGTRNIRDSLIASHTLDIGGEYIVPNFGVALLDSQGKLLSRCILSETEFLNLEPTEVLLRLGLNI